MPQAPAALLKSALICAGIVTLPAALSSPKSAKNAAELELSAETEPSAVAGKTDTDSGETDSLQKQLGRIFGRGGIRVTSRSDLPQGSGMGTSSILAGEGKRVICPVASAVRRAACIQSCDGKRGRVCSRALDVGPVPLAGLTVTAPPCFFV